MKNFELYNPTRVFFGKGETDRIGKEIKKYGNKVLLTYGGKSIKQNGLYDRIIKIFKRMGWKFLSWAEFNPIPE